MSNQTNDVTKSNFISNQPQIPAASRLPVENWNHIFEYLSPVEKNKCAKLSRQFEIIVNHDPTSELRSMENRKVEPMEKRNVEHVDPTAQISSSPGPSTLYLFNNPGSARERYNLQQVKVRMQKDPAIENAVMGICNIERQARGYVFGYHAMNLPTFSFAFFNKLFLSTPYPSTEALPCSPPLIRFPSPEGPQTIQEFFKEYPQREDSPEPYDHIPAVQRELIALNPYLFANFAVAGESTWELFIENKSVNPPDIRNYFKMLCAHYKLQPKQELLDKLSDLQAEILTLAESYSRRFLSEKYRDTEYYQTGMILQFAAPPEIIDHVAYASLAYGKIDTSSRFSLSTRCERICSDPLKARLPTKEDSSADMQIRMLIQSIFVPGNGIQVFTHGCDGFFSDIDPKRPSSMNTNDWNKIQQYIARKKEIIAEARELFSRLLMPVVKSENKSTQSAQSKTITQSQTAPLLPPSTTSKPVPKSKPKQKQKSKHKTIHKSTSTTKTKAASKSQAAKK